MKFIYASVLGLASASTVENNAMKKIVTLLEGMKSTIEAETAQGKKDQAEYEDFCIKSITETDADIKYGSQKVEEQNAVAEDGGAQASAKAAEAAECAALIGKSQADQASASDARKKEHALFVAEEAELVEADTMLGKAYSVLKRSMSLMQTGSSEIQESVTTEVVAALGQIIESAWIDRASTKKLTAFLEDSESLSMKQPQATSSSYDSKSGGILEVIQKMQEKNAEVLGNVRELEMKSRHAYEMVLQDLKNLEENKSEQMDSAKETGAKAAAKGAAAKANAEQASDALAADKLELAQTKAGCNKAAREWAEREEDAIAEMTTIAKAVEILTGKFGRAEPPVEKEAFFQLSNETEEQSQFSKRQTVSQILRKLGREYNQFALIQAAQSAQEDPFVKVRSMISDMIEKLETEHAAEASKEAKCKADKEKGAKDLKVKQAYFAKLVSRESGAKAKAVTLQNDISDLNTQLRELASSVAEANRLRNVEKADNDATVKDAAESISALSEAIKTLSEFYGAEASDSASRKNDSASAIIEILQTAQEDFEKLKADTEYTEENSENAHDKFIQSSTVSKTKKDALVQGKSGEAGAVKVQLSQISDDLTDAEKALQAANDFLKGVKEACANKAMSFEERQQRRAAEIEGLHEAMAILSPDGGESFIQTSFMAKHK